MTAIEVPYVDYEIESTRAVLGDIYRTASSVENAAQNLRDHWSELPTHLSGDAIMTTGYYSAMTNRTQRADELAVLLRDVWKALDAYADDAKTPLDNLVRLQEEARNWQTRQPLTVMTAPGTPVQDVWAAQAGYAPGTVCLAESPWTTWNREKANLEEDIAYWAREYERVAEDCAAALRRIKNPTAMAWWDHIGGSTPSRNSPIHETGDNHRWVHAADGQRFRNGFADIHQSSHTWGSGDAFNDDGTGSETQDGRRRPDSFGYGVQGVNAQGETVWGLDGEASTSYGNPDGVHGNLSASGTAGAWAEGTAGVNMKDGRVVAGVSGEVGAGVRGEAAASVEYGLVHATGTVDAAAGATVSGRANVSGGADGVRANAGFDAFAGAEASAEIAGGVSGLTGSAGVTGYAGIGVNADIDVAFSADSIKLDVDVGAALGLGFGVDFKVDINPRKVVEDIGSFFGF